MDQAWVYLFRGAGAVIGIFDTCSITIELLIDMHDILEQRYRVCLKKVYGVAN